MIGTGRKPRKSGKGAMDILRAVNSVLKDTKIGSKLVRKIPKVGNVLGAITGELGYGQPRRASGSATSAHTLLQSNGRGRTRRTQSGGAVGSFGSRANSKVFPSPYSPSTGSGARSKKGKGFLGDVLGSLAGMLPVVGSFAKPVVHALADKIGVGKGRGRGKCGGSATSAHTLLPRNGRGAMSKPMGVVY